MARNDPFQMANYNQMNQLLKREGPQAATAKRGPKPKVTLAKVAAKKSYKGYSLPEPRHSQPPQEDADSRAEWLARLLLGELASNPKGLSQVPQGTRLALIHHLSRLTP